MKGSETRKILALQKGEGDRKGTSSKHILDVLKYHKRKWMESESWRFESNNEF